MSLLIFAVAAALASPHTLTLADAETTTLAHQPQLRVARAATDAALARANEARAPILPQVNGVASYQRTTANFAARPGSVPTGVATTTTNSYNTYNYWSFGVTLSQFIWDFGTTTDRWGAAKATAKSQAEQERTTRATSLLNVRAAYYTARANRALADVARENVTNQDQHLRQIEGFVKVGQRPEIDLAQARSDYATAKAQLISSDNNYATAKAQLNLAMGVDGPAEFEVSTEELTPVTGEDLPPAELVDEARHARPELAVLEQQIHAQKLTITSARGGYFPSLSASMSVTDAGTDITNLGWNWNVLVNANWNLFGGLSTYSQMKEGEANVRGLEAQRDALRQQIYLDVEQARLAVRANKATLHATDEALVNARERLRLAEGRYSSGIGSVIELGDAQIAVATAGAQRTQAEFNLALARSQLVRALGRA